jgi:hypothetical protein
MHTYLQAEGFWRKPGTFPLESGVVALVLIRPANRRFSTNLSDYHYFGQLC